MLQQLMIPIGLYRGTFTNILIREMTHMTQELACEKTNIHVASCICLECMESNKYHLMSKVYPLNVYLELTDNCLQQQDRMFNSSFNAMKTIVPRYRSS